MSTGINIAPSSDITVGTTAIASGTDGRVLFQAGGVVQQDSAFFWDNTNKRLGVGATPASTVRLDVRAQGALSTDIAFRVRNSADDRNLFSILGNGDIEVRTNRVSLSQSTRLSIGGSNADNGLDAGGYTENTIVGFNNINTGRRATLIGSSNTINNAGTNACTTIGYGNSNRENGVVVGHSNTLGGIVLGTNNIGGGVGRTAVIGDNNSVSVANGNPGQPMFLIGNGVTLPNLSAINNCVFLSAGANSTDPFNTFKNDNLLIGSLTPWTTNFDNSSRGVFYTKNGTAPTTLAADSFGMYSADITAGNAAPHFRTENGSVVKLYQNAAVTTTQGIADALTNLGVLSASTISPTVQSVVSAATVTPTFTNDLVKITAQAAALTLAAPTGTAIDGKDLMIRIKDDGNAQTITWTSGAGGYRAIGVTLPTTTVISKTTYVGLIYNSDDSIWDVIGVTTEI